MEKTNAITVTVWQWSVSNLDDSELLQCLAMYMPLHLIENVEMNKHRGDTPLSDLQSARRNLYSLFS